jgi:tyrosine-specific transport protein
LISTQVTNLMLMGAYVAAGGDALGSADGYVGHRIAFFLAATLLAGAPSVLADAANSGLVVAMVGALGALLVVAAPEVDPSLLAQPGLAPDAGGALMTAAPILLGALVFQNVVPIIAKRFKGDTEKIRESVVLGSAAPAVAYIAFCASVLGRPGEPAAPGELLDAARGLPDELRGPACAALAVFSVTAVATSFTGAAVGQLEEIRGLVGDDDDSSNEAIVAAACFLPPLALALSGPNVFLPLLSLTGGYANTYLFGLLPCLLAWKHREAAEAGDEILPGGRYSLSALGSGAATMVVSAGLGDAAHAISTAVPHV